MKVEHSSGGYQPTSSLHHRLAGGLHLPGGEADGKKAPQRGSRCIIRIWECQGMAEGDQARSPLNGLVFDMLHLRKSAWLKDGIGSRVDPIMGRTRLVQEPK
jgi:hypothetical protein